MNAVYWSTTDRNEQFRTDVENNNEEQNKLRPSLRQNLFFFSASIN
jgi:hypothetical protein